MLEFRPHHFLCTLGFEGKGYSEDFVANYARIAARLRERGAEGDAEPIRVVGTSDSVCGPCPSRRGASCESAPKIEALDSAHAAILGLNPGDETTWGKAKARIAGRMTVEKFEAACAPCSWKPLGVCRRALEKLIAERREATS